MLPEIEKLLILQDSDQKIRTLRLELLAIPEQRAAKEKAFAEISAQLDRAKTRSREIELEKKRLELDVQSKQETIVRYKQHQLQTRKNEEYSALSHEISVAENVIRKIEDRELELMEEAEKLQPTIEAAQKIYVEEHGKLDAQLSGLKTRKVSIEARIQELEDARGKLTEGIEEDFLDKYSRLFKNKSGQAVVQVEHEVCSGCHMKVTTQTIILVKSEKSITHCPQCGRILYCQP